MPELPSKPFAALDRIADILFERASLMFPSAARHAGLRLLRRGRIVEAEALLDAAGERFPRHAALAARRAFVAEAAEDETKAVLERWREACALAPGRAASWRGLAAYARAQGELEIAQCAIAEALARSPRDWRVLYEAALVAESAGHLDEAQALWSRLVRRRKVDPSWWQGYATILLKQNSLEAAQAVLEPALRRHPDHFGLTFVSGQMAMRQDAWDKAHAIFSNLASSHPDIEHTGIYLARVATIRALAQAEAHGRPPQRRAPIEVQQIEDSALRELMLRFEPIGADCEFGTLQRRFGAEPLGLLRWNDVTYPNLVAALEARFAGMGEPDLTELVTGEIGEFYVHDRRWNLGMHTFLLEEETSHERLFPKMCRRVAYLRDKLLADLAAAEKIFVFKADDLKFDELSNLHALLERFGPIRLLHVRHVVSAGIGHWPRLAAGEVAPLAPGLLVGYVSRMGNLYDIPHDEWVAICRSAVSATPESAVARVTARSDA